MKYLSIIRMILQKLNDLLNDNRLDEFFDLLNDLCNFLNEVK